MDQTQQTDTLYQSYDKNLTKITGDSQMSSIMSMINADPSANNSTLVNIPADLVGSGQSSGVQNMSNGGIYSNKQRWSDTVAGFFFGIDTDGTAKLNIGNASSYIRWDGTNLSVIGGVSISSLDIPDTTTANSFHVDSTGNSWWGATTLGSAVAKILNTGAATFSNINVTGGSVAGGTITTGSITTGQLNFSPITAGGAASDVNGYATKINGTQIVTGSITSNQIQTNTLTVGTNVLLGTAQDSGGVTTIIGSTVTTSFVNALNITTANLNASSITSGTIAVGGTSQPGTIKIQTAGEYYGSAKIYWVNSSGTNKGRIWTDDNGYLGMNALGGQMYFYCNSNQALFVSDSSQSVFGTGGLKVQGSFNVGDVGGSTVNARFNGGNVYLSNTGTGEYLLGQAGTASWLNSTTYTYLSVGGTAALRASSSGVTIYGSNALFIANANKIDFQNWTLTMNANKTAIVPTSQGYNALYCTESPEVWFMDFTGPDKSLDPLFEEVSTGPYRYIKCEDGGYQVWGKRKGHEGYRFESKTLEEYIANEKFLNMNKPSAQLQNDSTPQRISVTLPETAAINNMI